MKFKLKQYQFYENIYDMAEKLGRVDNECPSYATQLVTKGDLLNFKADLLAEIQNLLNAKDCAVLKKWLKSVEVRKLLNISAGSLQNLRINGTLPYTKVGGAFYYNSEDIDEMLKSSRK